MFFRIGKSLKMVFGIKWFLCGIGVYLVFRFFLIVSSGKIFCFCGIIVIFLWV